MVGCCEPSPSSLRLLWPKLLNTQPDHSFCSATAPHLRRRPLEITAHPTTIPPKTRRDVSDAGFPFDMPTTAQKRKRAGDAGRANNNASSSSNGGSSGINHQLPQQAARDASNNVSNTLRTDITAADLSWTAREEGEDINPRTGERWLYPKKRGFGKGSNLEDFREEIEERTRNGQGCKAIAEILIEKGVDTSARAVSGQRMKWGVRQRVCLQQQSQ